MKIKSLQEANQVLQRYVPNVATFTGDNMSLERMWPLLEILGNPQDKLKVIHIAGTSGKTSTSYYIASILRNAGQKVGLTVSPHIDSVTERVQINGLPLEDRLFCEYLEEFIDIVEVNNLSPSYFELLIAFVYWVFSIEKVDYAVIETGMGGLLDGTNVASREDKVCVITDIGFDHMHILGDTLSKIARQKAGIIHKNNIVFTYVQSDEIMNEIETRVTQKSAILHTTYLDTQSESESKIATFSQLEELPLFQRKNWLLAENVCKFIAKRDNLTLKVIDPNLIKIPARMDVVDLEDGSKIIMDGAHNYQKMKSFVESYEVKFPNQKATIMLSLKKGKEYIEVIDALEPIVEEFVITTFNTSQDLPAVSQSPVVISEYCKKLGIKSEVIINNRDATELLLKSKSKVKIITGSFYLIGQTREYLKDIL